MVKNFKFMSCRKNLEVLTKRFNYIVVAIEEGEDVPNMMLERLIGSLYSHDQRMNQKSISLNLKQAL